VIENHGFGTNLSRSAGSTAVNGWQGMGLFQSSFRILRILWLPISEQANKIRIIVTYIQCTDKIP